MELMFSLKIVFLRDFYWNWSNRSCFSRSERESIVKNPMTKMDDEINDEGEC